jgi:hypothetical protein
MPRIFFADLKVSTGLYDDRLTRANNREAATVSGMACDSPVAPNVKPVDSKTITGSYPGDHRAQAAPAAMPANPAPRQPVGQFPNGKFDAK